MDMGDVRWTEVLRAQVKPRAGGAGTAEPTRGSVDAWFTVVREFFERYAAQWSSAAAEPELGAWMDAAAAWARAEAPGPVAVGPQACLAIMTGAGGSLSRRSRDDHRRHQEDLVGALVPLWWELGGPEFCVETLALVTALGPYGNANDLAARPREGAAVVRATATVRSMPADAWMELRRLLSLASAAQVEAARAAAREAWAEADSRTRAALLEAFPDETEWAEALGQEWLDNIETWSRTRWVGIPLGVRYPDAMGLKIVETFYAGYGRRNALGDGTALAVLDLYGVDALPILRYGAERSEWDDTRSDCAVAIAAIRTPEARRFLAGELDDRVLREVAVEALLDSPELAVDALAAVVAGRGRAADMAELLLARIDAAHPGLVDARLEVLEPAPRAAVLRLREALAVVDEADPAALPVVLSAPPWTGPRKKQPKPVVVALEPLPFEEEIVWTARDERRALQPWELWSRRKRDFATLDARVKAGDHVDANNYGGQALYYLPGLDDADAVKALSTWPADEFRYAETLLPGALAKLGLAALPGALAIASVAPITVAAALTRVASPRVAPVMAHALSGKAARAHAERWLEAFPEAAAIGLVPLALVKKPARTRREAEHALRWLAARGHEALITEVAARYGDEAAVGIAAALAQDPRELLPKRLPKMPDFWTPAVFPRPRLASGTALPEAAVEAIGVMLAISTPEAPYVGLDDVREACDPGSLERFAWALFNAWRLAGAPPKESWAFEALGTFGGDETARRLTPLIRAWPGERAQARAVAGLDVLAAIGSDVALMHLHGVALKLRFKALKAKAAAKVDEVAAERGLSAEELADRLVPDLDLEPDGTRIIAVGERRFTVAFDEHLAPSLRDEAGKVVKALPKKGADKAALKEANDTWKALKKDAKAVASGQITRLELAMSKRRRWSPDAFRDFFVGHPLVVNLARRLVWGVYRDGVLAATFRVAEDRSLADVGDEVFTLPDGAEVGVAHALELGDLQDAWGQVLGDYEIVQPFVQLGREVHALRDDERGGRELARFDGVKALTKRFYGLDVKGWRRGPAQDSGGVWTYEKPLTDELVAELALVPGLAAERALDEEHQTLGSIGLMTSDDELTPTWADVDPVAVSELIRDLTQLTM